MNSISPENSPKFSKAHGKHSNLLELLEAAPGEKVAIILPETGIRITYDSLRAQVMTLADTFVKAGIHPGDRIALALPNGLPAIVCFLAASFVGTATPLNPGYRYEEFCFYLEDTAARVLVVPPEGGDEARQAAGTRIPVLTVEIDPGGLVKMSTPFQGFLDRTENFKEAGRPEREPYPEDIALVLHTSGSTGRPKRVPLQHFNLAVSARNIVDTYRLNPDDVSLCVMPLFHVHGLVASVLATLLSGGTVVVPARFNPLSFWRVVRDYQVTWYSAVPTIHQLLLTRMGDGSEKPAGTEFLRFIRSCSAPLSPKMMQRMEEIFEVPVLEAYGMTEAAHQMTSNPLPPGIRKPGTVGLGTGVQIGIMDSDGQLLAPGQPGEVVIQGANVIQGYENNPEANISSFVKGWFRTGDQGVLDGDGYLRLIGRIKELINRGGEKISPREIDEVLLTHPAVAEAVCFGVSHPTWGEEVAAAVVLQEQVSESDLLRYCRDRLADFKCPKRIYVVDSIPRTATGKIQRRAVAEAFSGNPI
jgi:acyl-CoA synthetase (AMP-forming)/AMP-acid ligase II